MVVCPLSVVHNWVEEFHKFAPKVSLPEVFGVMCISNPSLQIPVCMYHGTPEERAELRRSIMPLHGTKILQKSKKPIPTGAKKKTSKKGRKPKVPEPEEDESAPAHDAQTYDNDFPVVITTYEMVIRDRTHLSKYSWGYIVVDEGHRLKNLDCRLMKEIKKYTSACRMVLTGTPLQVS